VLLVLLVLLGLGLLLLLVVLLLALPVLSLAGGFGAVSLPWLGPGPDVRLGV